MLQGEHSAILSTFIKLPFVSKIVVLSNFEWQFYIGFTVYPKMYRILCTKYTYWVKYSRRGGSDGGGKTIHAVFTASELKLYGACVPSVWRPHRVMLLVRSSCSFVHS